MAFGLLVIVPFAKVYNDAREVSDKRNTTLVGVFDRNPLGNLGNGFQEMLSRCQHSFQPISKIHRLNVRSKTLQNQKTFPQPKPAKSRLPRKMGKITV